MCASSAAVSDVCYFRTVTVVSFPLTRERDGRQLCSSHAFCTPQRTRTVGRLQTYEAALVHFKTLASAVQPTVQDDDDRTVVGP